jgi:hypothetical protein
LVFVGFGIAAPEWQWDDFKGVDVRDKILLVLVNDPGLRDSTIFRGLTLTYYGRWTYKFEAARRRAAVLVQRHDGDLRLEHRGQLWTRTRSAQPNTSLRGRLDHESAAVSTTAIWTSRN